MNSKFSPPIRPVDPEHVGKDVEDIFNEILRSTSSPEVISMWRTLANSVPVLTGTWGLIFHAYLNSSLPMSLKAMILFSISAARKCRYCSAFHEATCRTVGVDGETLQLIINDLDRLKPERVQEIVRFAMKCAEYPDLLTEEDFELVREQGINDEEIVEIVNLAAIGTYFDTLAEALKLEPDALYTNQLPGGRQLVR